MRLKVIARYVAYVVGLGAWIIVLNALLSFRPLVAVPFVAVSVAYYWHKRWRIPAGVTRTDTGVELTSNGQPMVVEFYADL